VGAGERDGPRGAFELVALGIVALFVVLALFVLLHRLVGVLWWTVKMVILVAVLGWAVRWAYRRSQR
jgi:hypothetical protein